MTDKPSTPKPNQKLLLTVLISLGVIFSIAALIVTWLLIKLPQNSPSQSTNSQQRSSSVNNSDPLPPSKNQKIITFQQFQQASENASKTVTKDGFQFAYDSTSSILYYNGSVTVNNGCGRLGDFEVFKTSDLIQLQIEIYYVGEICTQIIKEMPVIGQQQLDLSDREIENMENIIKIVIN